MRLSKALIKFLLFAVVPVFAEEAAQNEQLRDPTQPLGYVTKKVAEEKLELQAIFVRGKQREAVINGQQVSVGDVVKGAEVLGINDKSVVYRRKGVTGRLDLRASVIDRK